jgi:aminoglycoside N3'-acetyltransferase
LLEEASLSVPRYSVAGLHDALRTVGVSIGDVAVVHSSLLHLGRLEAIPADDYPDTVLDALLHTLGDQGTLALPASNWDYGKSGTHFDLEHSPPARDLGVLSKHLLKRSKVIRSQNPTFNLATIGSRAEWLCSGGNDHAFGHDSAWDRLFQLNAIMVFLGCDLSALSFTRYMEMRFGVPYLYNKYFLVPVTKDGETVAATTVSLLRYRHLKVNYDLLRFEAVLRQAGALSETSIGGGSIKALRMHECYRIGMECLKSDIHFFLAEPPVYPAEELPRI